MSDQDDEIQEFAERVVNPDPPEQEWRKRFDAYVTRYRGPDMWIAFIKCVAATGSIKFACQRSGGMSTGVIKRKRERYPEFDKALVEALGWFHEAVMERAAFVRAIDGVDEPVFHKGDLVGHKRVYSDRLMDTLLKGNLPDKYHKRTEVTGKDGGPLIIEFNEFDSKL